MSTIHVSVQARYSISTVAWKSAWKAVTTRCMQFTWSLQLNLMRQTLQSTYFLILLPPRYDCTCPGSLPIYGACSRRGDYTNVFSGTNLLNFWPRCLTVHTYFLFLDSDSTSTCSNDSIYYLRHPLSLSRVSSREEYVDINIWYFII
jgi:hypothetical protein